MPEVNLFPDFLTTMYFLNLHQMTPLHFAAEGGNIGIVEYLIENGADFDIVDALRVSMHISTTVLSLSYN